MTIQNPTDIMKTLTDVHKKYQTKRYEIKLAIQIFENELKFLKNTFGEHFDDNEVFDRIIKHRISNLKQAIKIGKEIIG